MTVVRCPFEVGQEIEVLSFLEGYRGGWFRCKIHDISCKKRVSLLIEYLDFPDEELEWIHMHQAIPRHPRKGKFLMCRPMPPKLIRKEEVEKIDRPALVGIVISGPWQHKERVEWLVNDIWWKAKVVGIREDGQVQVLQHWPPKGERAEDELNFAHPKDLRPALSWTVEEGWTVGDRWSGDSGWTLSKAGKFTPRVALVKLPREYCQTTVASQGGADSSTAEYVTVPIEDQERRSFLQETSRAAQFTPRVTLDKLPGKYCQTTVASQGGADSSTLAYVTVSIEVQHGPEIRLAHNNGVALCANRAANGRKGKKLKTSRWMSHHGKTRKLREGLLQKYLNSNERDWRPVTSLNHLYKAHINWCRRSTSQWSQGLQAGLSGDDSGPSDIDLELGKSGNTVPVGRKSASR